MRGADKSPHALVLMYHNVAPLTHNIWYVSPADILAHLQYLSSSGYRFETLSGLDQQESHLAILTFDDACENILRYALPVLQECGVPGTVFVPVDFVGRTNAFDTGNKFGNDRTEPVMTWGQLRELQKSGWSIQSHGCSHRALDRLSPGEIHDEVRRSRIEIEDHLGTEVFAFAYAYGILPAEQQGSSLADYFQPHDYRYALLACGGSARLPLNDVFRVPRSGVIGGPTPEIAGRG